MNNNLSALLDTPRYMNDLLPLVTKRMMEMYGVPSIGEWYDEQFLYPEDKDSPFVGGNKLLVMSMMSDVQEMIDRGLDEEARHTLNRAKWVLSNQV
jgi:hypothetical protein